MDIKIRIRPCKNGYIVTIYRGFWGWFVSKNVAKDMAEILEIIRTELDVSVLEVNRNAAPLD